MTPSVTATALLVSLMFSADVTAPTANSPIVLAQATVPPTGTDDANKPMPMVERMNRRFPQPVRVGDLIGLPVLDDRHHKSTCTPVTFPELRGDHLGLIAN